MFFEKKVDLRSRQAMVSFLRSHPRFHSMYSNCTKIYRLGLTRQQLVRAWGFLDTDYWLEIRYPIEKFTEETGRRYTIGVNGRSGGHLVLYKGEFYGPIYDENMIPDMDLSTSDLRERVELVCRFDRACDEIRDAFIRLLDNCKVVEETVMVPKTVRRLACTAA